MTIHSRFNPASSLAATIAIVTSLSALLVSCSSEPSASEIEGAMQGQMKAEQAQMRAFAGNNEAAQDILSAFSVQFTDFEKIGCREDGENAYLCDVRFTVTGGMAGKAGRDVTQPLRLVRSNDGWTLSH